MLTADLTANYEHYRAHHRGGWGLAWYLAAAIGERFYCSHGIAPSVLVHEGLGYYGMGIGYCGCLVKKQESLGDSLWVETSKTGARVAPETTG